MFVVPSYFAKFSDLRALNDKRRRNIRVGENPHILKYKSIFLENIGIYLRKESFLYDNIYIFGMVLFKKKFKKEKKRAFLEP